MFKKRYNGYFCPIERVNVANLHPKRIRLIFPYYHYHHHHLLTMFIVFPFGYSSNEQRVDSLSPLHAVIIFLITTLGGYLQIQYQSKNISPFDEHGNILLAIFLTLSVYAMCLMAEFKLQTHNSIYISTIKRFAPLIGILVVVLLMIILFPLLGLVAFILWALFLAEAVIKSFQEVSQWIRDIFTWISDNEENRTTANREDDINGREENGMTVWSWIAHWS